MAKKFLDESGLETLWDKVKSEDSSKLTEAKSYADTQASNALSNAKSYADEKIKEVGGVTSDDLANTLASAKSYTDTQIKDVTGITGFEILDVSTTYIDGFAVLIPAYSNCDVTFTAIEKGDIEAASCTCTIEYASGLRVTPWGIWKNNLPMLGVTNTDIVKAKLSVGSTSLIVMHLK